MNARSQPRPERTPDPSGGRRNTILETAAEVFLRYGYKKTSMDDLARAAGLSRQGLYLHFKTKDELFQAALLNLMKKGRLAYQAALQREDRGSAGQLLDAFEALHGSTIGQVGDAYVAELFEAASSLFGDALEEHERGFVTEIAAFLDSLAGGKKGRREATARELSETLYSVSFGLKHRVKTPAEYRAQMSTAIRVILANRVRE